MEHLNPNVSYISSMKINELPIIEALSQEAKTIAVSLVIEDSRRKNGQNTNEFNLNARENFVRPDVKQLEKITEESWEVFKIYLKVIASPTYING